MELRKRQSRGEKQCMPCEAPSSPRANARCHYNTGILQSRQSLQKNFISEVKRPLRKK